VRRAFTLIELLVVVAVIAALAAILFPVFARARERARQTHCANNLRQLGVAIRLYMDDWGNKYPAAIVEEGLILNRDWPMIREIIHPYVQNESTWICPSDWGETYWNAPFGFEQKTAPFYAMEKVGFSSYAYYGYGRSLSWGELAGRPASWVKKPSIGVLMTEMRPWHSPCDPYGNIYLSPSPQNVLYCDGHVARKPAPVWLQEQKDAIRR